MNKKPLMVMVLLIFSILSGCITPRDAPVLPSRGFFMGVLPIPGDGQSFEDSYKQVSEYAEFVPLWSSGVGASGFWDYADKLRTGNGKLILENYIRGNNMFPIIHFSFMDRDSEGNLILKSPESIENATLSNEEWRLLYKRAVIEVVVTARPLYISTGNEVNRWYEAYGIDDNNPNGFQHFVSLHEEIYDMVKKISPQTMVFCTFAREITEGNREADMNVLNLFNPDKMDLLVFTSYPFVVKGINRPSDIPDDYYSIASSMMPGKDFGFSELGWPSMEEFGGEKGQADFLLDASTRLTVDRGINLHLFGYCWLHDLNEYDHMGLVKRDGTEKMAYQIWKEISQGL